MEREIQVREVEKVAGRSGSTRYVVRDDEGNEYTTFRTQIGREAQRFEGRRASIAFHEEERRGFHNVYLDAIEEPSQPPPGDQEQDADRHADESAWDTALEAAPWIVGTPEPQEAVPPEELYERLHPFKEMVADDIRHSDPAQNDD